MLQIFPTKGDDKTGEVRRVAADALWLDLVNPTSAEVTTVKGHCQTKFYTATWRAGPGWSPTVFAQESPT
jgi:hypothetical protein